MKLERNKSITLGEQIAQTIRNIDEGRDTYPIDIVETKQVYYGLPNTVEPKGNIYQLEADRLKTLQLIAKKYNCLIITAATKPKEMKVFLVELNDLHGGDAIRFKFNSTDAEFIEEADRQGHVYTITEYQQNINNDQVSMVTKLIRFIEV
jgi:hypothetical protein